MQYTKEIIGHEEQVVYLQNQVKNGTVPHAQLWSGPNHIGKNTLLANYIYWQICDASDHLSACLDCRNCLMAQSGTHPNITILDGAYGTIKIDAIKPVLSSLRQSSLTKGRRFVVILNAHQLTLGAANALLKALEEPNDSIHFVIVSDQPDMLLETIRSRCAVIEFYSVKSELMSRITHNTDILAIAQGRPGIARQLSKESVIEALRGRVTQWTAIMRSALFSERKNLSSAMKLDKLDRSKAIRELNVLEGVAHDVLLLQQGMRSNLRYPFVASELEEIAKQSSQKSSIQAVYLLNRIRKDLQSTGSVKLSFDHILLTLYRESL